MAVCSVISIALVLRTLSLNDLLCPRSIHFDCLLRAYNQILRFIKLSLLLTAAKVTTRHQLVSILVLSDSWIDLRWSLMTSPWGHALQLHLCLAVVVRRRSLRPNNVVVGVALWLSLACLCNCLQVHGYVRIASARGFDDHHTTGECWHNSAYLRLFNHHFGLEQLFLWLQRLMFW